MKFKDIVVFLGDHPSHQELVQTAIQLATCQQAYLVAIIMSLPLEAQGDIGSMETYARGAGIQDFISHTTAKNDAEFKRNKISLEKHSKNSFLGIELRHLPFQSTLDDVALHCRYTDLVLLPQPLSQHSAEEPFGWSSEELILASGVPCLFVPKLKKDWDFAERVVIAWNASREARRAVSDAMPFISTAKEVVVLIINPHGGDSGHGEESGADIGRYLTHHGVSAQIEVHTRSGALQSDIILRRCNEVEASLLVIGGYGQPPLRTLFAGSTTQRILQQSKIPVLCSH